MTKEDSLKKTVLVKFIHGIELAGNVIPNPFWLFMVIWGAIIVLSAVFAGASAVEPVHNKTITVESLLTISGIEWSMKNVANNFLKFKAVGLVVIMMMGLGVATGTGMLESVMKKLSEVPDRFLIFLVFFIGIMGNIASVAASIIIPALTALLFFNKKKNPIFGLALGFAAVSAGFTANILLTGTDVLYSGISTSAYEIVKSDGNVSVTANYYFMAVSVFVMAFMGTFVTNKFLLPTVGKWDEKFETCEMAAEIEKQEEEIIDKKMINKGLFYSLYFTVLFWIVVCLIVIMGVMTFNAMLNSIIFIMVVFFIGVGTVYGVVVGNIKKADDVLKLMQKGIVGSVTFMLMAFPIANFIEAFKHSNIASVFAVKLSEFLLHYNFSGVPLMLGIIIIAAVINLVIISGSEKWALIAPVFIPAMYYLNYDPAATQLLFRIGDSSTNIITPMYTYIALHLATIQKYDKNAGMGTLISMTIPFSMMFLITWIIMVLIWYYFNLPIGPGVYFFMK